MKQEKESDSAWTGTKNAKKVVKKFKNFLKTLDKSDKGDILYNISGGRLAQSVEQGTENPRVPSSILGPATIFLFKFQVVSS